MHTYTHAYMHTYIYTYIHTYIHTHIYIHIGECLEMRRTFPIYASNQALLREKRLHSNVEHTKAWRHRQTQTE